MRKTGGTTPNSNNNQNRPIQTARVPGDQMLSFISEAETLAENSDEFHSSQQLEEISRQQKLFMSNMISATGSQSS